MNGTFENLRSQHVKEPRGVFGTEIVTNNARVMLPFGAS